MDKRIEVKPLQKAIHDSLKDNKEFDKQGQKINQIKIYTQPGRQEHAKG